MDNVTTIVDMTSDCRVTALAAVTNIALLRTSVVSCRDVIRDVKNVRPTLVTYTNAAFSYLQYFGSCLARVVLLTEYQTGNCLDYSTYNNNDNKGHLARLIQNKHEAFINLTHTHLWTSRVQIHKQQTHVPPRAHTHPHTLTHTRTQTHTRTPQGKGTGDFFFSKRERFSKKI